MTQHLHRQRWRLWSLGKEGVVSFLWAPKTVARKDEMCQVKRLGPVRAQHKSNFSWWVFLRAPFEMHFYRLLPSPFMCGWFCVCMDFGGPSVCTDSSWQAITFKCRIMLSAQNDESTVPPCCWCMHKLTDAWESMSAKWPARLLGPRPKPRHGWFVRLEHGACAEIVPRCLLLLSCQWGNVWEGIDRAAWKTDTCLSVPSV